MPHLYQFYLGGHAGRANLEIHDLQFVVAESVEDAIPHLQSAWFGDPAKLHLDGYRLIQWVDGYRVALKPEPAPAGPKLYFVNVGGYRAGELAELHEFGLFVANSAAEAKAQALKTLLVGAAQRHKDNLKEVDNQLLLDKLQGYHIHLLPAAGTPDPVAWQGYRPIGVGSGQ
ncbi:MAG: DUF1543 domain-containing protein [Aeromonadaceae bacterium]|nr:DUF1543 domain-containing protein [Aeromonadaceae bacterium]